MVNRLELIGLNYCQEEGALQYTFLADGVERTFKAVEINENGIRGAKFTPQGLEFLFSATRDVPRLTQAVISLTLRHIDGEHLELPIRLI
jgi:hypothetical protein